MIEYKVKVKERPPASAPGGQTEEMSKPAIHLPLLDFTLSVAKATVALTGALMAVMSTISGAKVMTTMLRSGAAMLAVWLMFWLVNWIIAHNYPEITQ